jgi:hypothetical protein
MTAKTIIQEFCRRTKVPVPNSIQGSADTQVVQILGLLNEMLDDFVTRKLWQQNTVEYVHTTLAAVDQGDISTLCPGFVNIVPDSFFNRTANLQVFFGLDAEQWQSRQVVGGADGPSYWARLRGNKLIVDPEPPAGEVWAFEYRSEYFAKTSAGVLKQYFTDDNDYLIIPERLGVLWLRWRWKAEKGLDYGEEFQSYENQLEVLSKRDNGPQRANLGRNDQDVLKAGIVVPIGNWELP